jgi:sugar lactone lactonase YvrE
MVCSSALMTGACAQISAQSAQTLLAENQGYAQPEMAHLQKEERKMYTQFATDKPIGEIEAVFQFHDAMPTGVTVANDGRIFINFPRWGDDVPFTVGVIKDGQVVAYPNQEVNKFNPEHPADTLGSVQSVVVDSRNRLWILDTAAPKFSTPIDGAAKLVAVDLSTDKIVKTIVFPRSTVLSTTYINDVRFDLREGKEGVAYITDSSVSGPGGIIVVDLASGNSWRKLTGHPSTSPDPTFIPIVEGERLANREKGKAPTPFNVASDGIALSPDGKVLYYCALSSRHLYSVPTSLLLVRTANDEELSKAVVDLGEKGASDGLESDSQGHVYAGDYEHNSIRQRQTDGEWKTIVHDPRVLWPDTMSVASDGYLYFTANQLNRQAGFHEGVDLRQKPYTLFRVKIDGSPIVLK